MQRWEPRYQALVPLADVVITAARLASWPRAVDNKIERWRSGKGDSQRSLMIVRLPWNSEHPRCHVGDSYERSSAKSQGP